MKQRLQEIRDRIARACESVDRDPAGVVLVAVSKTQPLEQLQRAYDLGLREFGESRLQEAEPKVEAMPEDVVWHFIGHLQSNKAKRVANLFSVLHTVCNGAQLREIGKSSRTGLQAFVEVNIAQEAQKSGVDEKNLDESVKMLLNYSNVQFCGLMTIGPAMLEPEGMRDYFRRLRGLNQQVGGKWLSMGMSGDFCVAVQEGSTHVRIGTALFGDRR